MRQLFPEIHRNIRGGGIFCDEADPIISNTSITNNIAYDDGGGLYFENSNPILSNIAVSSNFAMKGGGIYCETSNASISNTTISFNLSEESGGGIFALADSSLVLDNCLVFNNSTDDKGGGIYCEDSNLTITNTDIFNNSSYSEAGGLYLENSLAEISNLVVENNISQDDNAGGIYCETTPAYFENLIVINNTSGNDGGGIVCVESDIVIYNGLIANNTSSDDGGAFYLNDGSSPTLYNLTIVNNSVPDKGSGVYCSDGSPTMVNCIVANNLGDYGFYLSQGNPVISYCDFYNNETANFHGFSNNIGVNVTVNNNNAPCDIFHNIQFNPLFDSNGENPFALLDQSPCVNAGYPQTSNLPENDLAGNTRVYGEYVDIGAYENQNIWIVEADENNMAVAEIGLSNYPNPFNPSTTISFELNTETAENTELVIYNLKGQKVKVFSNLQITNSLNQQIVWNGTDQSGHPVSSGIYFYKLNVENSPTGKMLLLK